MRAQEITETTDYFRRREQERKKEQGVAEGSGNWYVRVRGKVLKDKQFNAIPFPSQEAARTKAMEIHRKKRTPLAMIKITQSWMDGPETQGVAEDDAGDLEKRMIAKIEKEKQRLAKLKQTDPEAYKREMAKHKTSSRIPPVSTF